LQQNGLLRNSPQYVLVDAEVVIENSTEYDTGTVKNETELLCIQNFIHGSFESVFRLDHQMQHV
jgi:hypothetical protein